MAKIFLTLAEKPSVRIIALTLTLWARIALASTASFSFAISSRKSSRYHKRWLLKPTLVWIQIFGRDLEPQLFGLQHVHKNLSRLLHSYAEMYANVPIYLFCTLSKKQKTNYMLTSTNKKKKHNKIIWNIQSRLSPIISIMTILFNIGLTYLLPCFKNKVNDLSCPFFYSLKLFKRVLISLLLFSFIRLGD